MKASTVTRLIITFLTSGGIQLLGLVSGILLARSMGPVVRGELAWVILWPSIIVYLGDLGGPNGYVYKSANLTSSVTALIGNILPIATIQSTALSLVGIPVIWILTHDDQRVCTLSILYLLAYVPINLITRYTNALNQGLGNFGAFNAVRIGVQALTVFGVLALWLFGSVTVEWVLAIILISNIVALGLAVKGIRQYISTIWHPDIALGKEVLSYGIKSHLGNLAPVDSMRLDLALISVLLGAYEVGVYSVATSSANAIRSIGGSVGLVAFPAIATRGEIDERTHSAHQLIRLTAILCFVPCVLLIGTAEWLVPFVYGREFESAASITQILAIGMVPASLRQVIGDCLRGMDRPIIGTIGELASWASLLITLPILYAALGLHGIAWAVSISYFTSLAVVYGLGWKALSFSFSTLLPRAEDFTDALRVLKSLKGV